MTNITFSVYFALVIKSSFKNHILTHWFIPHCSQGLDKQNGTTSGQIGPQDPSGSNLEIYQFLRYFFCCCFRSRALSNLLPSALSPILTLSFRVQSHVSPSTFNFILKVSDSVSPVIISECVFCILCNLVLLLIIGQPCLAQEKAKYLK